MQEKEKEKTTPITHIHKWHPASPPPLTKTYICATNPTPRHLMLQQSQNILLTWPRQSRILVAAISNPTHNTRLPLHLRIRKRSWINLLHNLLMRNRCGRVWWAQSRARSSYTRMEIRIIFMARGGMSDQPQARGKGGGYGGEGKILMAMAKDL